MVTKIAKPIRRMRRKEATRKESSNVAVIPEDLGKIPITTPELRVRESTSQTGLVKRTVAVLEGDGIGPEIMEEAVQTVELSGKLSGNEFKFIYTPFGAQAYFDYGHPFPKETKKLVVEADSVLKGPVGLPADEMDRIPVHLRPEKAGLLPLRTLLDTYFGLRPGRLSKSYADFSPLKLERIKEGIDILVAREQTEGIYFGKKVEGEETGMQYAIDECKYTREGVERFAHACFREAMKRGGKLTHVHKSNVEATSRFRDAIFRKIAPQYPGVEITTFMIDNFHYQLFIDPTQFKFVVMGNKDGDTGSDGVAGAVGSLGLMRTACWNPEKRKGYFEAAHGSAPKLAGKNTANPYSMIGSAAFMLELAFGLEEEASLIMDGLESVLADGFRTQEIATADTPRDRILSTTEFGSMTRSYMIATA